jgi:hypothetical protein
MQATIHQLWLKYQSTKCLFLYTENLPKILILMSKKHLKQTNFEINIQSQVKNIGISSQWYKFILYFGKLKLLWKIQICYIMEYALHM